MTTIRITKSITLNGHEVRRDAEITLDKPDDFAVNQMINYVEEKPILVRLDHLPEGGWKTEDGK